jgi:hypothetical protein
MQSLYGRPEAFDLLRLTTAVEEFLKADVAARHVANCCAHEEGARGRATRNLRDTVEQLKPPTDSRFIAEGKVLKVNLVRLAEHHKKHCDGATCNISLHLLRRLLERASIPLTDAETLTFL